MSFPLYSKYKESAVEWVGNVPANWHVDRLKWSTVSCKNGIWGSEPTGDKNDVACVRVADFDRQRLQANLNEPTLRNIDDSDRRERGLAKGDLLLEKSGGGDLNPVGCVVLYNEDSPAICSNFIARVKVAHGMSSSFWRYVHAAAYAVALNTRSIKQTSGIQNLDSAQYLDERGPFPPIKEQVQIAAFLDAEVAKIGSLIAEQQQLIKLLKEKRQALISRAVTKGLNPNAPLKPSGTEWLGDVPRHWAVHKLKYVATVQTGIAKGKEYGAIETVSVPYLRVANVQDGFVDLNVVEEIEIPPRDLPRYLLRKGDVLMNEGGDYDKLGRGCVWLGEIEPCITQNHVFAVRPIAVSSQWLSLIISTDYARNYFVSRSKQSTNLASISSTNLMLLPVIIPPEEEQASILHHIREQSEQILKLTSEAERAIALFEEWRTAIIFEAVTGKINVLGELAC